MIFCSSSDRHYLEIFFPNKNIFVITDLDLTDNPDLVHILIKKIKLCPQINLIIMDLSHNPFYVDSDLLYKIKNECEKLAQTIILVNDYQLYCDKKDHLIFFPVFLLMYSMRNSSWLGKVYDNNLKKVELIYDASTTKTKKICCLNSRLNWHRVVVFTHCLQQQYFDQINFTFSKVNLDQISQWHLTETEKNYLTTHLYKLPLTIDSNDGVFDYNNFGLDHSVYQDCAFNLTTETTVDNYFFHSEKTCKPFLANQIPIIIGDNGLAQFCSDLGLDLFSDIVPWNQWDHIVDPRARLLKICDFLDQFIEKDLIAMYQQCQPRIQNNKIHFHSVEFRQKLMNQLLI
jgi:hypothetical protein